MSHSSKKTPWFLRFAPGAILRKSGIIAVLAIAGIATVLTPIQTQAGWKWLVETLASWSIGKTLDAGTTALLRANGGVTITDASPRANAIVNGADWLSNEWTHKYKVQPIVDGLGKPKPQPPAWSINKNPKPRGERTSMERP